MNFNNHYNLFGEFRDKALESNFLSEYYKYNKSLYFISYNLCCVLLLLAGVFIDFQRSYMLGSAEILTALRILLVFIGLSMFPLFWKKENYDPKIEYYGLLIMVLSSLIVLLLNVFTGGMSKTMLPGILIITTSYYIVVPSLLRFSLIAASIQVFNFLIFYKGNELLVGAHTYMCFMIIAINIVLIFFKRMYNKTNRTNYLLKEYHRDLSQAKDTVLAIIGHDLRNPMTVITSRASLIRKYFEKGDLDKVEKNIGSLCDATERLSDLLQTLLKWALTNNVAQDEDSGNIDICFEKAIVYCKDQAQEKNITFVKNVEFFRFKFDQNMMETIIRNLLANAIKYSPENQEIHLNGFRDGDSYTIEIMDNGIGMDANLIDKILSGLNNESRSGTSGEEGTGLGLRIALDFIKNQNAKLDIKSVINKGTTFKINFLI